MAARHLVLAAALGLGALQVAPGRAGAQSRTTGAIRGQVIDETTAEGLAGVTIVVASHALSSAQAAVSDDGGAFEVTALPPGEYLVTFYYARLTVERTGVHVDVDRTTPVFQRLSPRHTGLVTLDTTPPTIDSTSAAQGIVIDRRYLRYVPTPGRTYAAAIGAAAGAHGDAVGVAYAGTTSPENQYYVDGVNTTGLVLGTIGTPVLSDFIEEIGVLTGGYGAEYGRATGGLVHVVTRSGSNELRGSVFGSIQPGRLTASAEAAPHNASSIDAIANNVYVGDVGFELGGPIVRDRLWYFVGFAPQFTRTDVTRTTRRQTDCHVVLPSGDLSSCDPANADSQPDVDPRTGFFVTDTLDEQVRTQTRSTYHLLGKLNLAATPEHQLQVSAQALPAFSEDPGIFGLATTGTKGQQLTTDLSTTWSSKLAGGRTELEAVIGWHRNHAEVDAIDPAFQTQPLQALTDGSLGVWGPGFGGESAKTNTGCIDGAPPIDSYPGIVNCPMVTSAYLVGGPGAITRDTEDRKSGALAVTHRIQVLGNHELKAGLDGESGTTDTSRLYSGGALIDNFVGQRDIRVTRWVQLKGLDSSRPAMENTDPRFDNICRTPDPTSSSAPPAPLPFLCDYLGGRPGDPGTQVGGSTLNWAAFARDAWQLLPNLTLEAGLRYEQQRLRYAGFLQHAADPLTEELLGNNAMTLSMWAPRIGATYDWTREGRSKVFAHWGRFYESIPMDINDRSFGGRVTYVQSYVANGGLCGNGDPRIGGNNGVNCLANPDARANQERLIGASGVLVAPGIEPQYVDELVAGVEYELIDDLKLGIAYHNRKLGRVLEDVSTDGANTYLVANPGEWSAAEEANLVARIARTDDPDDKQRLQNQLALFQGIRTFDKPRRDYHALQLTATRRFSRQLYLQGSYTYSRVTGNYPGLLSYDNGQLDPNNSSQYDLIELLANRQGPLPQDRPHDIKVDGYYTFDFGRQGALTTGARLRAFSGIPENALASHYLYGPSESFLLPRGVLGRTGFEHAVDLHVEYTRRLGKVMELSLYVDVFNVYNNQGTAAVDSTYAPAASPSGTPQNANPVSGGSYEDLIWVKRVDASGVETPDPIGRNPNFRNPTSRYAPASGRLGARLTF